MTVCAAHVRFQEQSGRPSVARKPVLPRIAHGRDPAVGTRCSDIDASDSICDCDRRQRCSCSFGARDLSAARYGPFQLFCLKDDPEGLWVAEDEGQMGFAWSWVCEDPWFLAQLFISPERQGRGIVIDELFDNPKTNCANEANNQNSH
jgi:hypothetical protein